MKCYLFVLPSGDMLLMNGLAALLARAASEMTMRIAPPTLPPNRPQCISLYDTVWVAALRDYLYSSKLLYRAEAITQTQNETHTTNMSDVTLVCMYTIGTCMHTSAAGLASANLLLLEANDLQRPNLQRKHACANGVYILMLRHSHLLWESRSEISLLSDVIIISLICFYFLN